MTAYPGSQSTGRNKNRVLKQELKRKLWGTDHANWLAPCGVTQLFFYTTQKCLPRRGTAHSGLAPPTTIFSATFCLCVSHPKTNIFWPSVSDYDIFLGGGGVVCARGHLGDHCPGTIYLSFLRQGLGLPGRVADWPEIPGVSASLSPQHWAFKCAPTHSALSPPKL